VRPESPARPRIYRLRLDDGEVVEEVCVHMTPRRRVAIAVTASYRHAIELRHRGTQAEIEAGSVNSTPVRPTLCVRPEPRCATTVHRGSAVGTWRYADATSSVPPAMHGIVTSSSAAISAAAANTRAGKSGWSRRSASKFKRSWCTH
jgi:hypothetical protein